MKGESLKKKIKSLHVKFETPLFTHDELRSWFIDKIVEPYLRNEIGLDIEVLPLKKHLRGTASQFDVRIESLIFEFKTPSSEISRGINEGVQK